MPRRRIIAPEKVGEVLTELGLVYKDARMRKLDTLDASRLASVLATIRQTLEAGDIEKRITELEERLLSHDKK